MYTDTQRYSEGGTSWAGYLASTGRRDRRAEREERAARFASAYERYPDCQYWMDCAQEASGWVAARIGPDLWDAWMASYPAGMFNLQSWRYLCEAFERVQRELISLPAGTLPSVDQLVEWFGLAVPAAAVA